MFLESFLGGWTGWTGWTGQLSAVSPKEDSLRCGYGTRWLSVMAIDFDVEKLIGKLDIIEKTSCHSPQQALKRFGHLFKTQLLPNKFNDEFDAPDGFGKPVPRTLNAALYEADGMTLRLSFKSDSGKGVSPANIYVQLCMEARRLILLFTARFATSPACIPCLPTATSGH